MMLFRKIDELTQGDHSFISADSDCYYFAEYPSGDNPENKQNPIYSLIHNIKKPMNRQHLSEWRYKIRDLNTCSQTLRSLFTQTGNIADVTLVPIPPSKSKTNPAYDPRMTQILHGIRPYFSDCDIRELLNSNLDMVSSHESPVRPTIDEIAGNYNIDDSLIPGCRQKIILVDDVLTTGAHFCAAKRKILERLPGAEISGYFIARRVPSSNNDFNIDDIFEWLK